jgi:hypothetical protein
MCPRTYPPGSARHFLATKTPTGLTQDVFHLWSGLKARDRIGDKGIAPIRALGAGADDRNRPNSSARAPARRVPAADKKRASDPPGNALPQ